jgi:hypothetical protein
MASAKNQTKAADAAPDFFNYDDYLPAGIKSDDGRNIGGFTPIYSPEDAWADGDKASQFPIVAGWLCYFEILPEKKRGKETFIPKMIKVIVEAATKGMSGTGDAKLAVDVPKGKAVMIPLTGNLLYNQELLDAVADEKNVHFATFRLIGQVDTGMPSPMWHWEVRLYDKATKIRSSDYALPAAGSRIDRVLSEGKVPPGAQIGRTADGQTYDRATGEVTS